MIWFLVSLRPSILAYTAVKDVTGVEATRARAGLFTTVSLLTAESCCIDLNRHGSDVNCMTGIWVMAERSAHDGG